MSGEIILSNQATCNGCGDTIFSATRHDYVTCSCGNLSVDGGMDYIRRNYRGSFKEQSISWDSELVDAMIAQVIWSNNTGRNELGLVCAIARAIRDSGYELVPVEVEEVE